MKEMPILYSTDMVKAYLLGKKIMTRRVIKPQFKVILETFNFEGNFYIRTEHLERMPKNNKQFLNGCIKCPYGEVGDRLRVKETWAIGSRSVDYPNRLEVLYKTTHDDNNDRQWVEVPFDTWVKYSYKNKWQSGRFMPHFASRLTQTITDIRIERINDISYTDCANEGFGSHSELVPTKEQFIKKWDELNAKRGYPFNSGCWVWVISYPAYKETE